MIKYEKYCLHDYVNVVRLGICIINAFIRIVVVIFELEE